MWMDFQGSADIKVKVCYQRAISRVYFQVSDILLVPKTLCPLGSKQQLSCFRDVAREVHYGEQACYESPTWKREQGEQEEGLQVRKEELWGLGTGQGL